MPRKIKDAKIKFISLCARGKNRVQSIFKDDGSFELATVTKALDGFDEKGQLVACVYPPDRMDSDGDWAPSDEIEKMAHRALRDGVKIDLQHDGKALDSKDAFLAESFLIQKGDPRFEGMKDDEGNAFDPTDGWGTVIQIDNPKLRKAYRKGDWNGVSMFGSAVVVQGELPPANANLMAKMDRVLDAVIKEEELDMNEADLKKILDDREEALVGKITKVLKPDEDPDDSKKKKEPKEVVKACEAPDVSEVDFSKAEEVETYLHALELSKIDKSDTKAVAAHLASLKKSDDDADKNKNPELQKLEKERDAALEKVNNFKKSSNQPAGAGDDKAGLEELKKADDRKALGQELAAYAMGGDSAVSDLRKSRAQTV